MGMLRNKVAVITGASSGIGRAAALLFSPEGAAVVLNARGEAGLDAVADQIRSSGGSVRVVAGDAGHPETHGEMVACAVASFGGLDIAFNNAATIGPVKPLGDVTHAEWQETLAATLTSAFP